MIITCPACASQFRVPDGALGMDGRKLRCSSCRHVWFQPATDAEPVVGAAPTVAAPAGEAPQTASAWRQPEPEPDAAPQEPPSAAHDIPEAAAAEPTVDEGPADPSPAEADDGTADDVTEADMGPGADAGLADNAPPAEEPAADETTPDARPTSAASTPATRAPAQAVAGWEPGAVMPRNFRRDQAAKAEASAPRSLRLVATETDTADTAAAPAYDVTRVVTPDSAPDEAEAPRRRRGGKGWLLGLLLILAIAAAGYLGHNTVMRFLPISAALYSRIGLVGAPGSPGMVLDGVDFSVTEQDGVTLLTVRGHIVNEGSEYRVLPDLHASLRDKDLKPTLTWTFRALADGLAPGAETIFESTYRDPPRTGSDHDVFVTFVDRLCPEGTSLSTSPSCMTTESSQ